MVSGVVMATSIDETLHELRFGGEELEMLALDVVEVSREPLPFLGDGPLGFRAAQIIDFPCKRIHGVLADDGERDQGRKSDRREQSLRVEPCNRSNETSRQVADEGTRTDGEGATPESETCERLGKTGRRPHGARDARE
jgi:hypothetical protein